MRGTLVICEDNEERQKLGILEDDVTEAMDLGIDAVHLRSAPSMVGEGTERQEVINAF